MPKVSHAIYSSNLSISQFYARCTAQSSNLDGPGGTRSREYDKELMEELESDQLWDNYGIDDDITVCSIRIFHLGYTNLDYYSHSRRISLGLTSTRCCLPIFFTSSLRVYSKIT